MNDFLSASGGVCEILSVLIIHRPDQLCDDAQLQLQQNAKARKGGSAKEKTP